MALKNDLSLSSFGKISLNEQWSEENVRNVSYTLLVYDAVVFSRGCFFNFKSSVNDRASLLNDRAKLNSGT